MEMGKPVLMQCFSYLYACVQTYAYTHITIYQRFGSHWFPKGVPLVPMGFPMFAHCICVVPESLPLSLPFMSDSLPIGAGQPAACRA